MLCSESPHVHVDHKLPFELRALEAALASALHAMEDDARTLTEHIQPILEGLTREVNMHLHLAFIGAVQKPVCSYNLGVTQPVLRTQLVAQKKYCLS